MLLSSGEEKGLIVKDPYHLFFISTERDANTGSNFGAETTLITSRYSPAEAEEEL